MGPPRADKTRGYNYSCAAKEERADAAGNNALRRSAAVMTHHRAGGRAGHARRPLIAPPPPDPGARLMRNSVVYETLPRRALIAPRLPDFFILPPRPGGGDAGRRPDLIGPSGLPFTHLKQKRRPCINKAGASFGLGTSAQIERRGLAVPRVFAAT